ncbi:MAG: hypothetical protein JZU64_15560, partial [Rhodoferax sp.]|nr:hypothetical protein [Rhodoferax sp.]
GGTAVFSTTDADILLDAATPPPTPPRGEAAAPAAPPPAPVVGAYAAASSGSSSVDVSPDEHDLRSWDEKLETSESLSPRTLLRVALRWPMMRDPPGDDGPEFPALAARATATALSVLSTRYLHLFCGNSPVLAACATTLLV